MIYGSVCSGIEAATQAWHPLGWSPAFFSEIEKFPSGVLAHHYGSNMPGEDHTGNGVPNHGDMTNFQEWPDHAIDLLVGGTPCQSFSVAGLRKGLADPRGNLMLTYLAIARRYRPRWLVWENVPGVLSSNNGRDFQAFINGLAECGYHAAWRVLDAQHVRTCRHARAVPQRRRRVFVVGYLGDWRYPAAVLFDRDSLQGNHPPRREARKNVAPTLSARPSGGGGLGTDLELDGGLTAVCQETAHTLRAAGFDASEDGTGRGTPLVPACSPALKARDYKGPSSDGDGDGAPILPVAFSCKDYGADAGEVSPTLRSMSHDGSRPNAGGEVAVAFNARQDPDSWNDHTGPIDTHGGTQAVAFAQNTRDEARLQGGDGSVAGALAAEPGMKQQTSVAQPWGVRRLTPRECERLQAFPDDYTMIPWRGKPADQCPAGPRYKALGNSMAVNVMQWIGERIQKIEEIKSEIERAA